MTEIFLIMIEKIFKKNQEITFAKIDTTLLINWVEHLYPCLFGIGAHNQTLEGLRESFEVSKNLFKEIISSVVEDENQYDQIVSNLYQKMECIHEMLLEDLESIFAFDPAAKNKSEIIFSYPGFYAIAIYRISNHLWEMKIPVIPRIISEYVHSKTGIDIHPGAQIGKAFFIDHGTGIVIGETAIIGNRVKIYQGVTLGALTVLKDEAEVKRHPTIEDDVIIYANATILGGKTIVGKNSTIGGNVWISSSIPSGSLVFNKSEVIIKNNKKFPEPITYII